MNDYFIRCSPAKVPQLMRLSVLLGLLRESTDQPGRYHSVDPAVVWVPLGTLHTPAADPLDPPLPRLDSNGDPWWHANLRVPFDSLLEYAQGVYAANPSPELGAALASMGDYFLLEADGSQRAPDAPAVVFA